MTITLTIAQQKGGAGKTTLAGHLLAASRERNMRAAGIDIDPQASLSHWYETRRQSRIPEDPLLQFLTVPGWRVRSEIDLLKRSNDILIIDSPPHAETEAKIVVRAADMVIVPVQPSPMDVWATEAIVKLAKKEEKKILLVLNRVPSRANLTQNMIERLERLEAPIAKSAIGNRTILAASMAEGSTALESEPSSQAAQEMRELFAEILAALSTPFFASHA